MHLHNDYAKFMQNDYAKFRQTVVPLRPGLAACIIKVQGPPQPGLPTGEVMMEVQNRSRGRSDLDSQRPQNASQEGSTGHWMHGQDG